MVDGAAASVAATNRRYRQHFIERKVYSRKRERAYNEEGYSFRVFFTVVQHVCLISSGCIMLQLNNLINYSFDIHLSFPRLNPTHKYTRKIVVCTRYVV